MKLPVFTKISTRSPPPLPSSVYKRSAGNGGQRCSFGLAGSSPSNLRLAPSLCTSSSSPCSHSARSQSHVAPTSGEFLLPSWKAHRKSSDQNNCLFLPFFFSPSRDFLPPLVTLLHERQFQKFSWPLVYIVYLLRPNLFRIRVSDPCWHVSTDMRPRHGLPTVPVRIDYVYRGGESHRKRIENISWEKDDFFKFWNFLFLFFWGGKGTDESKMAWNWIRMEFIFRTKFNKIYNSSWLIFLKIKDFF